MALKSIKVKVKGIAPLLQNNPQSVDEFNKFAKAKKVYTNKKSNKTDEDILNLRAIEIESKVFWDDDLGIYVPNGWLMASLAKNSWSVIKVKKDHVRAGIFVIESKAKLHYDGMELVKSVTDIVKNNRFNTVLILPQQNTRVPKACPIFHKWSFEFTLEYEDTLFNEADLKRLLEYCGKFNGFGDFRPTYGRALVEAQQC